MTQLATLLLAVGMTCVIVGCGGGEDGETAPPASALDLIQTSSITKAEYIERAERICEEAREGQRQIIRKYLRGHPDLKLNEKERIADAVYTVIAPRYEHQVAALASLGAPAGDEGQLEAILATMKRAIEGLERRDELSLEGGIAREFTDASQMAHEYGIRACGR